MEKLFAPTKRSFPEKQIPEVVFDEDPRFPEFWHDAWRIAWKHVYESDVMPCSPYLGEGCGFNRIWIWDSSFMTLFSRYAPDLFPAENTLDNFYRLISGNKNCGIEVHHPDNPPLFSWAEREFYRMSGDRNRVIRLMESGVLQKHYDWLEHDADCGTFVPWGRQPVMWKRLDQGYLWSGCPSGMDNTPRGRDHYQSIYWVDALAQQGLNALHIAQLLKIAGKEDEAALFIARYEEKKALMQTYFDPERQCFLDRLLAPHGKIEFCPVITPAGFWALMAEMATPAQAEAMVKLLTDPEKLGGVVACPSVARDDPDFNPDGAYWRGSVWLPVFYMTMKAIAKYGWHELARKLSVQLIDYMKRCYDEYSPHTIWECYNPMSPIPAKNKAHKIVRADFCGWSALAPISLFLENVIGLENFSAADRTVFWRLPRKTGKRGIRNLLFGKSRISLIADSCSVETVADEPFTLEFDGRKVLCPAGNHCISRHMP